jgi:dTDP-L-rhamnose 4-epimerase
MHKRVLMTGGAAFLGAHLADVLSPQVHGRRQKRPTYLPPEVESVCKDIGHADAVRQALHGVSAVFHFAAALGVGQSVSRRWRSGWPDRLPMTTALWPTQN